MEFEPKKVEVISIKATQAHLRLLSTQQEVKMNKKSFQRYLYCGWFEVVNQDKLSSVI